MKVIDFKFPNCPICDSSNTVDGFPRPDFLCEHDAVFLDNGYIALIELIDVGPNGDADTGITNRTGRILYLERAFVLESTNIPLEERQPYVPMDSNVFNMFAGSPKTSNESLH